MTTTVNFPFLGVANRSDSLAAREWVKILTVL